jgi:hypothetical protein
VRIAKTVGGEEPKPRGWSVEFLLRYRMERWPAPVRRIYFAVEWGKTDELPRDGFGVLVIGIALAGEGPAT